MEQKKIKNILKKIIFINKYRQYIYLFKINIEEIEEIGIKNFTKILLRNNIKNIHLKIDDFKKETFLLNIQNILQKLGINTDIYLKINTKYSFLKTKINNINYIFNLKYNLYEYKWISKNIKKLNKNATCELSINSFKNQLQVNESKFLEIFNLLKNNNLKVNTEYIRYESAFKNQYILGPKELNFDLSEYCNANCIFCYTNGPGFLDNRFDKDNNFKQKNDINKLINQIKTSIYCGVEELTIGITGEPFIEKEIVTEFLSKIRKTKIDIGFLTNGYSLNNNINTILKTKNIKKFYINISAGDYSSFKKTRIGDNFRDFINTWESINILKNKRPDIYIKILYVVTPLNFGGIKKFIDLAKKHFVNELELKEVVSYGFDKSLEFSENDKINLYQYLNNIDISCTKNNIMEFKNSLINKCYNSDEKIINKCYNHYLYTEIVRNNTYTCCKFILKIGKIKEGNFKNLYKNIKNTNIIFKASKNLKKILGNNKHIEKCSKCFHIKNITKIDKYIKIRQGKL